MHPRDQRAMFAIPWEGVTIVGTTDVDHGALDVEPCHRRRARRAYLLEVLGKALPLAGARPRSRRHLDVVGRAPGDRHGQEADPSKESREHAIWREDGLLTITGGKLTTFAVMAREALAAAEAELGGLGPRGRIFAEAPGEVAWPERARPEGPGMRLLGRHGSRGGRGAGQRRRRSSAPSRAASRSGASCGTPRRAEGVVTLSDLLLRRVRLGLLLPRGGLDHIAAVRAVAQPALGWDDARWAREQADVRARPGPRRTVCPVEHARRRAQQRVPRRRSLSPKGSARKRTVVPAQGTRRREARPTSAKRSSPSAMPASGV
jgi:glycerol-3-phosphate dehydrogenase